MRGDSVVAGEGKVVSIPKFHSWGKCTMPLTNIRSDWISNINEQSNRTPRRSQEVSAAGLPWLEHFRVQCYT